MGPWEATERALWGGWGGTASCSQRSLAAWHTHRPHLLLPVPKLLRSQAPDRRPLQKPNVTNQMQFQKAA